MAITLAPSTAEEHEQLPARNRPGRTNPVLLEAIRQIGDTDHAVRLFYDTTEERGNIARQLGRLAARAGLTLDIRYGEDLDERGDLRGFVSVRRGEQPYVPKPARQARAAPAGDGRGRGRRRAEGEAVQAELA